MKTMNDVNELRLAVADLSGHITARVEDDERAGCEGMRDLVGDCLYIGAVTQYVGDLEVWVTLRKRVMAMMGHHDPSSTAVAALQDVIDIMDELDE